MHCGTSKATAAFRAAKLRARRAPQEKTAALFNLGILKSWFMRPNASMTRRGFIGSTAAEAANAAAPSADKLTDLARSATVALAPSVGAATTDMTRRGFLRAAGGQAAASAATLPSVRAATAAKNALQERLKGANTGELLSTAAKTVGGTATPMDRRRALAYFFGNQVAAHPNRAVRTGLDAFSD